MEGHSLNNILKVADVGVLDLAEVGFNVAVKVNLDVVPTIRANDSLVIGNLGAVDDCRTSRFDQVNKLEKLGLHVFIGMNPEALPRKTKGSPLEGLLFRQILRIAALWCFVLLCRCVVIALVKTVDSIKYQGSIPYSARERSNRVLVLTLRNDTGTGCQADSRLNSYESIAVGGVNDYVRESKLTATVRLSTKRKSNSIGSNADSAACRTAARIDGKIVGTTNLATAGRVALGHGACVAKLLDDMRIAGDDVSKKCPTACGGFETILGSDVVFDSEWNSVEGASNFALCSFGVALSSNCKSIRIDLHDGAVKQLAPVAKCICVDHGAIPELSPRVANSLGVLLGLVCPDQVAGDELNRSKLPSFHGVLHLSEGRLFKLEPIAICHGEEIR
ncbi:hypothetical protein HG531_000706 [Fusarium graminearum]|nr:hypothetical protein HG531_000706 [Fusarium graminearum]